MKHLGIFPTTNDIQTALNNNALVKPYIALTGQSSSRSIDYNVLNKIGIIKITGITSESSGEIYLSDEYYMQFNLVELPSEISTNNIVYDQINYLQSPVHIYDTFMQENILNDILINRYVFKEENNNTILHLYPVDLNLSTVGPVLESEESSFIYNAFKINLSNNEGEQIRIVLVPTNDNYIYFLNSAGTNTCIEISQNILTYVNNYSNNTWDGSATQISGYTINISNYDEYATSPSSTTTITPEYIKFIENDYNTNVYDGYGPILKLYYNTFILENEEDPHYTGSGAYDYIGRRCGYPIEISLINGHYYVNDDAWEAL